VTVRAVRTLAIYHEDDARVNFVVAGTWGVIAPNPPCDALAKDALDVVAKSHRDNDELRGLHLASVTVPVRWNYICTVEAMPDADCHDDVVVNEVLRVPADALEFVSGGRT
jgi:hypothetical protein